MRWTISGPYLCFPLSQSLIESGYGEVAKNFSLRTNISLYCQYCLPCTFWEQYEIWDCIVGWFMCLQHKAPRVMTGQGVRVSCRMIFQERTILTAVLLFILELVLSSLSRELSKNGDINSHNERSPSLSPYRALRINRLTRVQSSTTPYTRGLQQTGSSKAN